MANKLTDNAAPPQLFEDAPAVKPARKPRAPSRAAQRRANAKAQRVTAPGFYMMKASAYYADPCPAPSASSGVLRQIVMRSPAHARLTSPEPSEAMDIGSALHALLAPEAVPETYRDVVDWLPFDSLRGEYAVGAKNAARRAGRIPVLVKHRDRLAAMVAIARPAMLAWLEADSFSDCVGELVGVIDRQGFEGARAWSRIRLDIARKDLAAAIDYKSTARSAAPEDADRLIFTEHYHIQQQHYVDALDQLDPRNAGRRRFAFFVQETDPPFAFSIVEIDRGAQAIAAEQHAFALAQFDRASATGVWPGYTRTRTQAPMPAWMETQWHFRAVELGLRDGDA